MCYVAVGYKYNMHSMKELQKTRRNQEYRTAIKCSPLSLNMTGSHWGPPRWQIGQCQAPRSPKILPDPHVCTIQGPTKNQQREDALGNPPLPNWSPVASLHYHQDCSSWQGVSCNYFYLIAAHEDLNSTHLAEIPYWIVCTNQLDPKT